MACPSPGNDIVQQSLLACPASNLAAIPAAQEGGWLSMVHAVCRMQRGCKLMARSQVCWSMAWCYDYGNVWQHQRHQPGSCC